MDAENPTYEAKLIFSVNENSGNRVARALDILAVVVLLSVLFRFFIAPRFFAAPVSRAFPFVLPTVGGSEFALRRHRGRLIFLEFSASWCEACKASLPLVERFARTHREVEVIVVDSGDPPPVAAHFAQEQGLGCVALDVDQRVRGAFGILGFPTMVVIDPAGFIRARWEGYNPAIEAAMDHARASFGLTFR